MNSDCPDRMPRRPCVLTGIALFFWTGLPGAGRSGWEGMTSYSVQLFQSIVWPTVCIYCFVSLLRDLVFPSSTPRPDEYISRGSRYPRGSNPCSHGSRPPAKEPRGASLTSIAVIVKDIISPAQECIISAQHFSRSALQFIYILESMTYASVHAALQ